MGKSREDLAVEAKAAGIEVNDDMTATDIRDALKANEGGEGDVQTSQDPSVQNESDSSEGEEYDPVNHTVGSGGDVNLNPNTDSPIIDIEQTDPKVD